MNKILSTFALTLLLAACASSSGIRMFTDAEPRLSGYKASLVSRPNPTAPNVFVVDNRLILVDQEPIYPPAGNKVTIFFGLEEDGDWVFREHGIEIKDHGGFCDTLTKYVAKCKYDRPEAGTVYKYKVKVQHKDGSPTLRDLDPTIMN